MPETREELTRRLEEWLGELEKFELPDWEALPQLDLYMDQVILLLNRYLSPMVKEEKYVTASIINNYVRMKVMPPPVKKRYSRVHLAYLVIICTLKQSLSISCIQRMLPAGHSEEAVRAFYTDFVRKYRASTNFLCSLPVGGDLRLPGGVRLPLEGEGSLATTSAILSTLSKSMTEFLLEGEESGGSLDDEEE